MSMGPFRGKCWVCGHDHDVPVIRPSIPADKEADSPEQIIDDAIAAYRAWMIEDDYDAISALRRIVDGMRIRMNNLRCGRQPQMPPAAATHNHGDEP